MMLSPIVLEELLSVKKMVCIIIALIGMLFIVGNGFQAANTNDLLGITFGLLAGAFYAKLMLINKFIKNFDRLELTIIQLALTAAILLPYVLVTEGLNMLQMSTSSIPFILFLRIVNTGIGFWLYFAGMEKLTGQTIAMLSYVDPFVAIFISGVILLEPFTTLQIIGGLLLLGATFTSIFQLKKP